MTKETIKDTAKTIQTTGAVAFALGFILLFVAYCVEETTRTGYWIAAILMLAGTFMALFGTCVIDAEFDDRDY